MSAAAFVLVDALVCSGGGGVDLAYRAANASRVQRDESFEPDGVSISNDRVVLDSTAATLSLGPDSCSSSPGCGTNGGRS